MSIATMILGESGSGKSTSMRNLDPSKTLLIQAVPKSLPFEGNKNWRKITKEDQSGSVVVSDNAAKICTMIGRAAEIGREIVVIDDAQYIMANEFMRRSHEKSYDKFNDIGRNFWDIIQAAISAPDHMRVYILSHTQIDDMGRTKAKTIGKMLDDKITLEGLFTIVLKASRMDGKYKFTTQTSGMDTCKSPMGMFESETIDNDLAAVDAAVVSYYQ